VKVDAEAAATVEGDDDAAVCVEAACVVVIAGAVVAAGTENDEGTKADAKIEFKKAESVLGIAVHFFPLMERIEAPAGRLAIMKRNAAIPVAGKEGGGST